MRKTIIKITSVILIVIMLLSMTLTAFAEEPSNIDITQNTEENIEGSKEDGTNSAFTEADVPEDVTKQLMAQVENENISSGRSLVSGEDISISMDETLPESDESEIDNVRIVNNTISTVLHDGATIKITGQMPSDAEIEAEEVFVFEVSDIIDGAEDLDVTPIKAYDIKIVSNGEYFQPEDIDSDVKVSIKLPDLETVIQEVDENLTTDDVVMVHIDGDENVETIEDVEVKNNAVTFETDSFSVYVLATDNTYAEIVTNVTTTKAVGSKPTESMPGETLTATITFQIDGNKDYDIISKHIDFSGSNYEYISYTAGTGVSIPDITYQKDGNTITRKDIDELGCNLKLDFSAVTKDTSTGLKTLSIDVKFRSKNYTDEEIQTKIDDQTAKIHSIYDPQISALEEEVAERIETINQEYDPQIEALEAQVQQLTADSSTLNGEISTLKTQIKNLNDQINAYDDNLTRPVLDAAFENAETKYVCHSPQFNDKGEVVSDENSKVEQIYPKVTIEGAECLYVKLSYAVGYYQYLYVINGEYFPGESVYDANYDGRIVYRAINRAENNIYLQIPGDTVSFAVKEQKSSTMSDTREFYAQIIDGTNVKSELETLDTIENILKRAESKEIVHTPNIDNNGIRINPDATTGNYHIENGSAENIIVRISGATTNNITIVPGYVNDLDLGSHGYSWYKEYLNSNDLRQNYQFGWVGRETLKIPSSSCYIHFEGEWGFLSYSVNESDILLPAEISEILNEKAQKEEQLITDNKIYNPISDNISKIKREKESLQQEKRNKTTHLNSKVNTLKGIRDEKILKATDRLSSMNALDQYFLSIEDTLTDGTFSNQSKSHILSWTDNANLDGYYVSLSWDTFSAGELESPKKVKLTTVDIDAQTFSYTCSISTSANSETGQSGTYEPGMIEVRLPYAAFEGTFIGGFVKDKYPGSDKIEYVHGSIPDFTYSNKLRILDDKLIPVKSGINIPLKEDATNQNLFCYEIDEANNEIVVSNHKKIEAATNFSFNVIYGIMPIWIKDMATFDIYAHTKGKSTTDTDYVYKNTSRNEQLTYQVDTGIEIGTIYPQDESEFQRDYISKGKNLWGIAEYQSMLNQKLTYYYGGSDSPLHSLYRNEKDLTVYGNLDFDNYVYVTVPIKFQLNVNQPFLLNFDYIDINCNTENFDCLGYIFHPDFEHNVTHTSEYGFFHTDARIKALSGKKYDYGHEEDYYRNPKTIDEDLILYPFPGVPEPQTLSVYTPRNNTTTINITFLCRYKKETAITMTTSGNGFRPKINIHTEGVSDIDTHASPDENDIDDIEYLFPEFYYESYTYPQGDIYSFDFDASANSSQQKVDYVRYKGDSILHSFWADGSYDANYAQTCPGYKHKMQVYIDKFYWNIGPTDVSGKPTFIPMTEDDFFADFYVPPTFGYKKTDLLTGEEIGLGDIVSNNLTEYMSGCLTISGLKNNMWKNSLSEDSASWFANSSVGTHSDDTFSVKNYQGVCVETPNMSAGNISLKIHTQITLKHNSENLMNFFNENPDSPSIRIVAIGGMRHFHSEDNGITWVEDLHFPDCYDDSKVGVGQLTRTKPDPDPPSDEWWGGSISPEIKNEVYQQDLASSFYSDYDSGWMVRGADYIQMDSANSKSRLYIYKSSEINDSVNKKLDVTFSVYGYEKKYAGSQAASAVEDLSQESFLKQYDFAVTDLVSDYGYYYILLPPYYKFKAVENISTKQMSPAIYCVKRSDIIDSSVVNNFNNTGRQLVKVKISRDISRDSSAIAVAQSIGIIASIDWDNLSYSKGSATNNVYAIYTAPYDRSGNDRSLLIGGDLNKQSYEGYNDSGLLYYHKQSSTTTSEYSITQSDINKYLKLGWENNKSKKIYTDNYDETGNLLTTYCSGDEFDMTVNFPGAKYLFIKWNAYPQSMSGQNYFRVYDGDKTNNDIFISDLYMSENKIFPTDSLTFSKIGTYSSWKGFYGEVIPIYAKDILLYDFDGDKVVEQSRVTALYKRLDFTTTLGGTVESGLETRVAGENENYQYNAYANLSTDTNPSLYSYRIAVKKGPGQIAKNIVLYDILESAVPDGEEGWKGTFDSVDTSYAESLGITPTVYYSTQQGLTYPIYQSLTEADTWYQDTSVWSTTMPDDKSTITAVAIDFGTYEIPDNSILYAIINMKAPSEKPDAKYAYNMAAFSSYSDIIGGSPSYSLVSGSPVVVMLSIQDITINKVWDDSFNWWEDRPDKINVQLLANGTPVETEGATTKSLSSANSWTYTYENQPVFDTLTGAEITYTVVETKDPTAIGNLDNYTPTISHPLITIGTDDVTGDPITEEDKYAFIVTNTHNNDPNDIYFGKFDTEDRTESDPLSGAIFNLEYWNPGSDVTSTADTTSTYTSDTYDLQSLSDGYYKLTEQTPVPNYGIVPPIFFTIKNGLITLDEPARTDAVTSTYDSKVMLSVFDTPLAELSSTGGNGIGDFIGFGLSGMIISGMVWYQLRRKKNLFKKF